jgi:hypothetical protein
MHINLKACSIQTLIITRKKLQKVANDNDIIGTDTEELLLQIYDNITLELCERFGSMDAMLEYIKIMEEV